MLVDIFNTFLSSFNIPEVDFGCSISDTIDRLVALKQRLQNGRVSASSAFPQEECVGQSVHSPSHTIAMHFKQYARLDEAHSPSGVRPIFSKWTLTVCHDHTKSERGRYHSIGEMSSPEFLAGTIHSAWHSSSTGDEDPSPSLFVF